MKEQIHANFDRRSAGLLGLSEIGRQEKDPCGKHVSFHRLQTPFGFVLNQQNRRQEQRNRFAVCKRSLECSDSLPRRFATATVILNSLFNSNWRTAIEPASRSGSVSTKSRLCRKGAPPRNYRALRTRAYCTTARSGAANFNVRAMAVPVRVVYNATHDFRRQSGKVARPRVAAPQK